MNEQSSGSCAAAYVSAALAGPGIDPGAWFRMASATLSSVQHSPGGVCSCNVAAYDDTRLLPGVPRARRAKLRAAIEAMPAHCQAALVPLLDLEAGALLDKRDFTGALQLYERAAQARDGGGCGRCTGCAGVVRRG
jgi:hypothetical protein